MSRKWKFHDDTKLYFISYAVVDWVDVFTRIEYKEALLKSWRYCQQSKGLDIYAWCIMPSHVHLVLGCREGSKLSSIVRDMKKHTSHEIKKLIETSSVESRKEWLLERFRLAGLKNGNNNAWQFWQQNNKPIEIKDPAMLKRAIDYIHLNPVKEGYVSNGEDWLYSSAGDYAGKIGLLDTIIVE